MELDKCHMTVSKKFCHNAMLAKYGLLIFGRSGASWRINFCKTYSRTVFGSYN